MFLLFVLAAIAGVAKYYDRPGRKLWGWTYHLDRLEGYIEHKRGQRKRRLAAKDKAAAVAAKKRARGRDKQRYDSSYADTKSTSATR